jgi:hypothetical protein
LLCHFECIIHLDAEVAHRTFQLGVPEQQLPVSGGPAQRVE